MIANIDATLPRPVALRIVERVAAGVQKHIVVADETGHVVASSDGAQLGAMHNLAARAIMDGMFIRDQSAAGGVLGLPLVHGGHVVGAIVLDGVALHAEELGYMARALAELIIHQMTVIDQLPHQAWAREKFLFDLLHNHLTGTPDIALQEAALLDIDLERPRVVVLIAIEWLQRDEAAPAQPGIERRLRREQRGDVLLELARDVMGYRQTDVMSFIGSHRLAILPEIDPHALAEHRHRIAVDLQRFIDVLRQRVGDTATAGVGRYYAGWPALAQSFADAQFALEIGRQIHGSGQVFFPGELGVASFVCSNDPLLKAQLAQHLLHQIEDEPELLGTIEVFLESDLSPSQAAERLHIHRHTLAHRLDKVVRLTGLDPRRFQDIAQLHAALIVRRTCA